DSTPGRAGAFSPSSSRGRAGPHGLTPRGYRGRRPGGAAGLGTRDVPLAGAVALRRIGGRRVQAWETLDDSLTVADARAGSCRRLLPAWGQSNLVARIGSETW